MRLASKSASDQSEQQTKRKARKCKSTMMRCGKCVNFNGGTCSLDGKDVDEYGVCRSFSSETTEPCQRCGRKVHYKNRDEYYNSIIHFSMDSDSGSSSGQNIHLCRKCETEVFSEFQDFLEKIRSFRRTENGKLEV